jgi:MtN3 and saliva related transmembrane protein
VHQILIEGIRVVTVVASFLIAIGLYDQAFKIWRTRSARDFTSTLILALVFYEAAWLAYGISISEWPIIVVSAINVPATVIAALGYLRYQK